MRITCPTCDAAYEVPDKMMGAAPRRLRCAKCHEEWLADPSPPIMEAPASPAPSSEPQPPVPVMADDMPPPPRQADVHVETLARLPATAAPPVASSRVALAAWGLSLVVLAVLGAAAFQWRDPIMQAWPPSQRAYAVFGLR